MALHDFPVIGNPDAHLGPFDRDARTVLPQQTFSLPITVFGLMVVLVIVFLLVALGAIITWQTPRNPWVKAKYHGLVILTLAFNAICWLVIWSLYQTVT